MIPGRSSGLQGLEESHNINMIFMVVTDCTKEPVLVDEMSSHVSCLNILL